MAPPDDRDAALRAFRSYLMLLARLQIDPRLQGLLDPSDLVQQTLLRAHQRWDQCRGATDAERAGALSYLSSADDRRRAWEDVAWAVVNSKEFLLRH